MIEILDDNRTHVNLQGSICQSVNLHNTSNKPRASVISTITVGNENCISKYSGGAQGQ